MNDHIVLKYLGLTALLTLNDRHNQKMLDEGQYIPWWKRHLLLTLMLVFTAPVILIGAFIIFANVVNPSAATVMVAMQVLLYGGGLLVCIIVPVAYFRAEKRWKRAASKPTKVIDVR